MFENIVNNLDIPTPLALGGLILSGLITVFLAILKLKIFPKLNKELGEKVISQMMRYLFVLALVGMLLGFVGYIIPMFANGKLPDGFRVNLPNGLSLQSAAGFVAEPVGYSVDFKNCDKSVLNVVVKGGTYGGKDAKDVIEKFRLNLNEDLKVNYQVTDLKEKMIYEVHCN